MARFLPFALIVVLGLSAAAVAKEGDKEDLAPMLRAGLVKLHVTSQSYETTAPWKLGSEYTRTARGVGSTTNLGW